MLVKLFHHPRKKIAEFSNGYLNWNEIPKQDGFSQIYFGCFDTRSLSLSHSLTHLLSLSLTYTPSFTHTHTDTHTHAHSENEKTIHCICRISNNLEIFFYILKVFCLLKQKNLISKKSDFVHSQPCKTKHSMMAFGNRFVLMFQYWQSFTGKLGTFELKQ